MTSEFDALRAAVLQYRDRYQQFGVRAGAHAMDQVLELMETQRRSATTQGHRFAAVLTLSVSGTRGPPPRGSYGSPRLNQPAGWRTR